MSYLIIDGEPRLIRTLDRYVGRTEDNLQRQCICARCPSVYTDLYLNNAHKNVVAMFKDLGLKNATVFVQGFIDGDTFRFYDPGIRFPGSEYESMLKSAADIDIVKAYVAFALGNDLSPLEDQLSDDVFLLNGYCGLQIFIDAYPGIIDTICGAEDVSAMPEVVRIVQKHGVGYEVPDSGDVGQRVFEIVLLTENTKDAIEKAITKIEKSISIKDVNGKELRTPMIETGSLFG